ncbi:MAG: hypothetical protein NUW06_07235, partial [Candidatus Acetothermia bacterium]|nr:hypothetical protein [Candidatus Acetothermia bacterium]
MLRLNLVVKVILSLVVFALSFSLNAEQAGLVRARAGALTTINFRVRDKEGDYPITCSITNTDLRGFLLTRFVSVPGPEPEEWYPFSVQYFAWTSCYHDIVTAACTDCRGATGKGSVEVIVNCPPVITVPPTLLTHWRKTAILPLKADDRDGDPITWEIKQYPDHCCVEQVGPGSYDGGGGMG